MATIASGEAAEQIARRLATRKPESNNTCESHTRSRGERCSAAMKRSAKVSHGASGISSSSTRPASTSRRVWRRKLWNSWALASTRIGRFMSKHE